MLFCNINTGKGPYYLIELNNVMFSTLKIQNQWLPVGFFLHEKAIEII